MDAGGLAQMSTFPPAQASGLASRRGGTNVKPLSFDTLRSAEHNDTAVPTPRTSRGHMLAGLRTAPKTATAAAYPGSPVTANKPAISRNVSGSSLTSNSTEFNGPKSAMPRFAGQQKQQNYATLAQMTSHSPPKRNETPSDHAPLPPPSANAFRRGHKKVTSVAANNNANASNLTIATEITEDPKSAGPKSNSFPANASGTYGPGQARAGEHPVRQPRGPPSIEELRAKPTAKFEGSKNFATRTRRSAVHNLVRAGLVRRKGTSSSTGSMSPVSETAEEADTPITDNESDSGRSGSGSLAGDAESRVNTRSPPSGWGAIGSDRPNSRSKDRKSENCVEDHSFAGIFKNAGREVEGQDQRKAPMLVLTSAEKRKTTPMYA
ncbi:hypothetical protein CFIMG_007741RA00001 [Ceratocystis fimbriata CBS 114723]|uniref:Uncharacterized protein n=1 Tax=Ceratocystis fimbriata CBS 114723 TaxID=1035309 RepID=A0A2C5XCU7_9PEZI|nr:hypothetical protein CFIMG_007741RA00001 [Ceratocystis fimbriata CBS 114723]